MNRKQRRKAQSLAQATKTSAIFNGNVLFDEACKLHQAGKLTEAESLYQRILDHDANHADSLHHLGIIHYQSRRHDSAATLIARAIQFKKEVPLFHSNLANVLREMGRFNEAINSIRQAITLNPAFAEAYNNLGNIYIDLGKRDEAAGAYEKTISLNPSYAIVFNNLANIRRDQGRLDEAFQLYEKALFLQPHYADAHNNIGNVLMDRGDIEGAILRYQQALRINPDYHISHYNLGNNFFKLGKPTAAIPHLKRYLELNPQDQHGAGLLLAAIGEAAMPERASDAQIRQLYASRAQIWENALDADQSYQGHKLVAEALHHMHRGAEKLIILDTGCGTGLVGMLIHEKAHQLDGIDMSMPMLEKAKTKGVYHQLFQGDLVAFLKARPAHYDVVTCAATLIHFGDLNPVFQAASAALKPGGSFISTIFPNDDNPRSVAVASGTGLAQGGCYVHGRDYIKATASAHGFAVELMEEAIHEYHQSKPITCLVLGLRRITEKM